MASAQGYKQQVFYVDMDTVKIPEAYAQGVLSFRFDWEPGRG